MTNHFDSNSVFEAASGRSSKHSQRSTSKLSDKQKNPGLKIISRQVMNAVREKEKRTYKDVAVYVSSINENNPSLLEGEENDASKRQEKNLRRRVYDSLNVLYAVGVLKKRDKMVYCDFDPDFCSHSDSLDRSAGSTSPHRPQQLSFSDEQVRAALPL